MTEDNRAFIDADGDIICLDRGDRKVIRIKPSAGTNLYIASPGTELPDEWVDVFIDEDFTEVGSVSSIGEIEAAYEEVNFTDLQSRRNRKFKASRNDSSVTLELGYNVQDGGQEKLKEASRKKYNHTFSIVLNDGEVVSFEGVVMSHKINVNDSNSIVGATVEVSLDSGSLYISR